MSLADIDIYNIAQETLDWSRDSLWNENTLYQLVIVGLAFSVAIFMHFAVRKTIMEAIDSSELPIQAKRICHNIRKLILPFTALVSIFVMSSVASSDAMGLNVALSQGMMQVLLAWIIIRFAVQFIANNLVRNIFALAIWVVLALSIFGVLEQTTTTLDAIGFTIGKFRISALAIIKSIFSLFILLYMAIFASSFVERKILQVKSLTRTSQVLIAKVVRVALIVFALLIGVTSAGIDLSLFAVFGGAIGLGIGFGLQKGISNLFSGMLLLLDRSIKPGDVIEIPDIGTFGWVNNMAARYTEIVTRDNKSFLIPNEELITQRVVNWSHGSSLIRIEVQFGVDYAHNPHEIKAMAEKAAGIPERVCSDPKPVCHLVEFGESSMNFKLRFWIKDAEKGVTNMRGAVMLALWDTFKENNIKIPYPHREVYIREQN